MSAAEGKRSAQGASGAVADPGELHTAALGTAAREFGARCARMLTAHAGAHDAARAALEECAALLLVRSAQGHSFLDFDAPVVLPQLGQAGEGAASMKHVAHLGTLEQSGLLRAVPQPGDLLVLEKRRLYLRRLWEDEVALAQWLRAAGQETVPVALPEARLQELLKAAFPEGSPPEQAAAVRASLGARLSVITGGPGTGKTYVVARLLLLLATAHPHGSPLRVALLAPTGKAARRLDAGMAAAAQELPARVQAVARAWPEGAAALQGALSQVASLQGSASTVHAALQADPSGAWRFRRNAARPLDADVVVLDEASMVSLPLMRALCQAVAPHARLIILGDRDQLQSPEAGSVLADITAGSTASSTADSAASHAPRAPCVTTRLVASRRFPVSGGLGRLAEAVRTGQTDAAGALVALQLLDHDPAVRAQVQLVEPRAGTTTQRAVELAAAHAVPPGAPEERLQAVSRFTLLCAHSRGPGGAQEINRVLQRGARADGTPVIVLRNAPDQGLWNGDVGVLCAAPDGTMRAHFDGGRSVRAELLPEHAAAYALTVHKSQGSEYQSLALVLPEQASPVLTRELVYTALTRWRASADGNVTIVATRAVLEEALRARTQRASTLRERLSA